MDKDFIVLAHIYSLRYHSENPLEGFESIVGKNTLDEALEVIFKNNGFSYKYTDKNSRRKFLSSFFPENSVFSVRVEVKTTPGIYDFVGKVFMEEYIKRGFSDSLIVSIEDNPLGINIFDSLCIMSFEYDSGRIGIPLLGVEGIIVGEIDDDLKEHLRKPFSKIREHYAFLKQEQSFEDFYRGIIKLKAKDNVPKITYNGVLNA